MPQRLAASILCLALILAAACSSSDGAPDPTQTAPPLTADAYVERGPHGVGVTTLELTDVSRPTAPNGGFAGSPERVLRVEVWYPTAPSAAREERDAAVADGEFPLIIFAHGFSASRVQSPLYTRHLASHGYIVAAPDFPGSFGGAAGGPRLRAVIEQPADASFLIDELLMRDEEPNGLLSGAIDAERIGMTGHSLGGLTTLMTAYGDQGDERIDAALPISPPACFLGDDSLGDVTTPLMVLGGSEEIIVDPAWIRHAYEIANEPRYYVELGGADHVKFADVDINDRDLGDIVSSIGGENLIPDAMAIAEAVGGNAGLCVTKEGPKGAEFITGDRQRELLRFYGALFFDAYLRGNDAAIALIRSDLNTLAPEVLVEFDP